MIGIYKIENLINHHCYIGQSVSIEERWRAHRTAAFNEFDPKYEYPLYRAFRKYGLENFSFLILKECSVSELDDLEKTYITEYNCIVPNGYN